MWLLTLALRKMCSTSHVFWGFHTGRQEIGCLAAPLLTTFNLTCRCLVPASIGFSSLTSYQGGWGLTVEATRWARSSVWSRSFTIHRLANGESSVVCLVPVLVSPKGREMSTYFTRLHALHALHASLFPVLLVRHCFAQNCMDERSMHSHCATTECVQLNKLLRIVGCALLVSGSAFPASHNSLACCSGMAITRVEPENACDTGD